MNLDVVIMAAGKGSRMHSATPKVLHRVAGVTMLERVLNAAIKLQPKRVAVVYHDDEVLHSLKSYTNIVMVKQNDTLGTGHAAQLALKQLTKLGAAKKVLILCADLPLLTTGSLKSFCEQAKATDLAVCSFFNPDPFGFGRVVRDGQHHLSAIVEQRDASAEIQAIKEVNSGVMVAKTEALLKLLPQLKTLNQQREYYLTDCVALALAQHYKVEGFLAEQPSDFQGVNDMVQLAYAERLVQQREVLALQQQGVKVLDPARLDVRGIVKVGRDVQLDVDVVLEGEVELGNNVQIGPFCHLKNVKIKDNAVILAHCDLEGAEIGNSCSIGPFARLRPGTCIASAAKVGNFVEVKNSAIAASSKVSHLSYIGDSIIGKEVNIGAGTITCNYDGQVKHQTRIGDKVFVGSNSALVAPVTIGASATIGAGSVITEDVAPSSLALGRSRQVAIAAWKQRTKRSKKIKK